MGVLGGFIVSAISALGYAGVAGLMAIESACIPLPSEIIMPFAGYLASIGKMDLFWAATAGALGCNIGSTIAYAVGFYGGRPAVERWGRYVLFGHRELLLAERFFGHMGGITVLIGRLLPVVRTFIALPAGLARMPMLRFQVYTFVGSWPWCFGLAYAGYRLGEAWNTNPRLHAIMQRMDVAVAVLLAVGVVWYVRRLREARRARR
ncbi:MAG: DedA family protein [Rhodospirillales bacterium]|jgi:membrane protein DedA with SNARE-associated domain|nr:DedA family protein [Rhodospirillales bacterium]